MYLGFDYGLRKIGVAIGQGLSCTATPLTVLNSRQQQPDWSGITRLVEAWQPGALVVGMPVRATGGWQPMVGRVKHFMRELQRRFALPVYAVDERYSSWEARLVAGGEPEDAHAARIILESWLRTHA